VGQNDEVAALVGAMVEKGSGHGPDFFTIDVSAACCGSIVSSFSWSWSIPVWTLTLQYSTLPAPRQLCRRRVVVACLLLVDAIQRSVTAQTCDRYVCCAPQGSEGGTGAAPPEFSNSVGTPLVEGLVLVDDLLRGAGLRQNVKIICSGKVRCLCMYCPRIFAIIVISLPTVR